MAVLSAKARKALPPSKFAGPHGTYPVPDKAHAINAMARAKQQLNMGHLSDAEYARIVAKAKKVIGK